MKPMPECRNELGRAVLATLERYFHDLEGQTPTGLYALVMDRVESELIRYILARADGNQTLAAQMLGINRNTLRRKIQQYHLG
ncbi:helix-turn-helix domain-containing protein [Tepidiphilus sp. J10]|uniref:helix-turn-helix domain-containing protein n=1 Tax=Tepidiphilus sp. J10 TaxID=2502185 RepID=UPI001C8F834C|nr:helix-turn-helix domain-containing protein [Tepidiphilus sp. J10]